MYTGERDEHSATFLVSNAFLCVAIFEVLTAVTMKNGVFWDIKPQFVLNRRHNTPPLQSSAG
jgi:hypothetical protein